MDVILFLVFGLVIGALARLIVPGRESGGWIVSILFGIGGALLGGFLGRIFGLYQRGEGAGFVMSLVGAVILVAAYHALVRRSATA